MTDIQIVIYNSSYKGKVVKLFTEFLQYLESIDPLNRTNYADGSAEYFLGRMLDKANKQGKVLLATVNDEVIGFIGGHVSKQDKDEIMEMGKLTPGYIDNLFVSKNYRDTGVGARLIEALEEHFRLVGCDIVRTDVFAPNNKARKFYNKCGYSDRAVIVSKKL